MFNWMFNSTSLGHSLWLIISLIVATIWLTINGIRHGVDGAGYGKKARARANKREDKRLAAEVREKIEEPLKAAYDAQSAFAPTEALCFFLHLNGRAAVSEDWLKWVDAQYQRLAASARGSEELTLIASEWAAVIKAATPVIDELVKRQEIIDFFTRPTVEEPKTQRINSDASGNDLRPSRLRDIIGQDKVVQQIDLLIRAAKARCDVLDHMLLAGPPGLGKSTLSLIVANEMGTELHVTSGPALKSVGDLHAFLKALEPGDLLFVDEIHRMPQIVNEALYIAVEDFRADIDGARVTLPKFTLVGATTHAGLIPGPLRDRFGYTGFLEPYSPEDLATIVTGNARKLGIARQFTRGAAREIAARSRNTPRAANTLLKRVRDYWQAHGGGLITRQMAVDAIEMFDIDSLGLDRLDRHVLRTLARYDQPIGLKTLAAATGEAEESVEESEGFMIRLGFIVRTPQGRVLTAAGRTHVQSAQGRLRR